MKKYTIGLLSVAGVFALVAIATAPTSAATTAGEKTANTGRINKCNKQAESLAKVATDLEFFKGTYYVMPSAEEIAAHYPPVTKKGSQTPVPSAIYKGAGPKSRVGKTNYAIVAKRFTDTHSYFSSIVLKNTSTPALDGTKLNQFGVNNVSVNAAIIDRIDAITDVKLAFPAATYDCSVSKTHAVVAKKYSEKVKAFKKVNKDISIVKNKTKDSRASYQELEAQRVKLDRQKKI